MHRSLSLSGRRESGFVLIAGIFVVLLLGALALGLVEEGRAARTQVGLQEDNLRALEIAEIGIVHGETEIRDLVDLDHSGAIGGVSGDITNGHFDVEVINDPISPERWILRGTGSYGFSKRRIEVGVRRWVNTQFADALFSVDSLSLSNTVTDAYDSRLGSYASQATNSDAAGTYAQLGGGVGSNGDVYLGGTSVYVRGNAIPGPLHETYLSGGPTVFGDCMPREFEIPTDPASEADFLWAMQHNDNTQIRAPGNGNTVRYNAHTYTLDVAGGTTAILPGGTYFFTDVFLRGGSTLQFTGPAKIYVTGSFNVAAGTNILGTTPSDLQVYAHPYDVAGPAPATTTVAVNGGSKVMWTLWAPGADLVLGGGNDFYGSSVAKTVDISGTNSFHYDKALGTVSVQGAAHLERLFWHELDPPRR